MLLATCGSKIQATYQGFKKKLSVLYLFVQYSLVVLGVISGFVPQFSNEIYLKIWDRAALFLLASLDTDLLMYFMKHSLSVKLD